MAKPSHKQAGASAGQHRAAMMLEELRVSVMHICTPVGEQVCEGPVVHMG